MDKQLLKFNNKVLKQHPKILVWCLLLLTLNSYLFVVINFVGVQKKLSDLIQILGQDVSRYELNQKRIQLKFNPPSSPWMGGLHEAMVKFTKRLKEIVEIMYLHWVGSVLTITRLISRNLFLRKVTRKVFIRK